jgi:hypothetical protein
MRVLYSLLESLITLQGCDDHESAREALASYLYDKEVGLAKSFVAFAFMFGGRSCVPLREFLPAHGGYPQARDAINQTGNKECSL